MNLEQRYENADRCTRFILDETVASGYVVPHWLNDTSFWYSHRSPAGTEYRVVGATAAEQRPLFDHDRLAAALRDVSGLGEDAITARNLRLTLLKVDATGDVLGFSAFGKDWLYAACTGNLEESKAAAPPFYAASPNGCLFAFVRNHNIWVLDQASGREWAVTRDGEAHFAYGRGPEARWARPIAGSEAAAPVQVVWSEDSNRLLTVRCDERLVRANTCVDYAPADGTVHEVNHDIRWARPGDAHIPEATLYAIDVEAKTAVAARYNTVPAVRMLDGLVDAGLLWWGDADDIAYFVDVERGEKLAHLVEFCVKTGACRRVFSESSDTYVELGACVYTRTNVYPVKGAGEVIWSSERSGAAHLYLYDVQTGELKRPLTAGAWRVVDVVHVDEKRREVFFTAAQYPDGEANHNRVLCRASLDEADAVVLTPDSGDHSVLNPSEMGFLAVGMFGETTANANGFSPGGDYFVDSFGTVDSPLTSQLRTREGALVMELARTDVATLGEGWTWPEPFEALAADGKTPLSGVLYKPAGFNPQVKYPLIDYIYGGPQVMHVPRVLLRTEELLHAGGPSALAALGFVVVVIDGRGTAGRSRDFHAHSHGAVQKASDIDDHVHVIEQLAQRFDYIDVGRVGITGFSAGGFATANAMLRRPDFFKVGVAGSGNYDQRAFWHSWGERYHGLMKEDNYDAQSLVKLADKLEGKLLFTHGLLDAGCVIGALFQLVQALQAAHKDFDLVLEPRMQHEQGVFGRRKSWDFFVRHLAGTEPPAPRPMKNMSELLVERSAVWTKPLEAQET